MKVHTSASLNLPGQGRFQGATIVNVAPCVKETPGSYVDIRLLRVVYGNLEKTKEGL